MKIHTVRKGESLATIAKQHGTTINAIAKQYNTSWQVLRNLNKDKIKDPDKIQVGLVLKVPPKNSGLRQTANAQTSNHGNKQNQSSNSYAKPKITTSNYQVEKGDTLGSIAQRSGKSISDLQRINGIHDPNKIKVGQYIKTGLPNTPQPAKSTPKTSPQQTTSTNGQGRGMLDQARSVATDLLKDGAELAKKGADAIGQTIDSTTQAVKDGTSAAVQTISEAANGMSDTVSGWFGGETQKPEQSKPKPVETTTQSQRSQNEDGTPKVVVEKQGRCSCNRDLTLSEFNNILDSLGAKRTRLFNAENCELNQKERNAETLLKFLNQVFKKYEINTCLRRIHFLAQIYHESDKFQTTTEYSSGLQYEHPVNRDAWRNENRQKGDGPKYRGRGLMQLTWKKAYRFYFNYSGIDVVSNYSLVSSDLNVATDSSGWFWHQGKILKEGDRWRGSKDMPSYLKKYQIDFPKKKISNKGETYYSIDMNLIADADQVDTISYLVNGGNNGLPERQKYVSDLKRIFGFPNQCSSVGVTKPIVSSVPVAPQNWYDPMNVCILRTAGLVSAKGATFGKGVRTNRNGTPRSHQGVDFRANAGTPIKAVAKGKIKAIDRSYGYTTSWGAYILLECKIEDLPEPQRSYANKHSHEYVWFFYAHLSYVDDKLHIGSNVVAGQAIGKTGDSGSIAKGMNTTANGGHLHFEARNTGAKLGTGLNGRFDPLPFFPKIQQP